VLTHYGRPGGKVKPELSTEPLAVIARSLLAQQGYLDIQVIHHEGSITEEGVAEGLKDRIVKGAINVLENTRFCPGDEKNDPVFAKALAELAGENGIFVFDGFGAGEREHASTTGVAEHLERIALGPLVVNEERAVRGALENLYGVIFGGGPKFDEKVVMLEKVVGNIKQGGFLFIGSGPAPAFLKAHPDYENIKLGQKPSEKDITAAKKVLELAKERNIPVILPKDFVVSTKEIVDKKIPEDAKVFVVTLDKLKKGTVEISGETISPEQIFVYDVGPDSWVALDKALSSLPKESSVVWNGDLGVKEISLFASGTQTAVALLGRFSKNKEKPEGLNGVVLGADTGASIEQFVATPAEEVTYVSTGGGAALGLLEGRELTAVVKLAEIQTIKTAEKLNVGVNTYRDAKKTDRAIYDAQGQQTFSKFINAVASSRPTTEVDKKIRALIIGPNFFKIEEVISALSETAKISDVVKIALYGKNAQKMKVLLGSEDIIAGKTLSDVLAQLDSQKILQDDTVLLRSPEDRVEKKVEVRQVVASELSTLALAKAIRELLTGSPYVPSSQRRRNIGVAFSVLFSDMMEANIISKTVWAKYVSRLEDSVTKEKAFEFPADLAPTPEATKRIEARTTEAERKAREELVTAICG
jgi:phosphoglycerate kinase